MQREGIDRMQDNDVIIFGCIHSLHQEYIAKQHGFLSHSSPALPEVLSRLANGNKTKKKQPR